MMWLSHHPFIPQLLVCISLVLVNLLTIWSLGEGCWHCHLYALLVVSVVHKLCKSMLTLSKHKLWTLTIPLPPNRRPVLHLKFSDLVLFNRSPTNFYHLFSLPVKDLLLDLQLNSKMRAGNSTVDISLMSQEMLKRSTGAYSEVVKINTEKVWATEPGMCDGICSEYVLCVSLIS